MANARLKYEIERDKVRHVLNTLLENPVNTEEIESLLLKLHNGEELERIKSRAILQGNLAEKRLFEILKIIK